MQENCYLAKKIRDESRVYLKNKHHLIMIINKSITKINIDHSQKTNVPHQSYLPVMAHSQPSRKRSSTDDQEEKQG